MKKEVIVSIRRAIFAATLCLAGGWNAVAGVLYVDVNSINPVAPYTSWANAASNIQDAVDAAGAGDTVLVTNGVYKNGGRIVAINANLTNRVAVDKAVTVMSVNGPAVTSIVGFQVPGTIFGSNAVRGVYLGTNANLIGFTVTDCATFDTNQSGGAVRCVSTANVISNCVIQNSYAAYAAGVLGGTLYNCVVANNTAVGSGSGGAVGSIANDCRLTGNQGSAGGGAGNSVLNNCLVTSNTASAHGGATYQCTLNNCTVVGNIATNKFADGGGTFQGTNINCIIMFNIATNSSNTIAGIFANCCTAPVPAANGPFPGITTNDPLFVNFASGDYHLQSNSPCINAGNNIYVSTGLDFGGNPRIVGGTVDMGAYEYQSPTSVLSYAWLQQYGLATDGSADFADGDHDGMNNFQEWRAGTDPTSAGSALVLGSPTVSGTNIVVTWQSVTNHAYYLQRGSNFNAGGFLPLATNIVGQAGTTSYTDTNAAGAGAGFYRVGVQ